MAEKKIHENPLPEEQQEAKAKEMAGKPADKPVEPGDKPVNKTMSVVPVPTIATPETSHFSMPSLNKGPTFDLYKKLLPAVLFLLTFVTVMTMLLIYMDTVALEAQQFRVNMSRDYELERIPQESPALVQFVRQFHLASRAPAKNDNPQPTPSTRALDRLYGEIYNGTFVEFLPRGGRARTTRYLEAARGWRGLAARAHARDCLALRGAARALHACLSATPHPREVTYHEGVGRDAFSSRVLCLPLYTALAAADAARAHYTLLGGDAVLPALTHLPFHKVQLQTIEIYTTDPATTNNITKLLQTKNYTVVETFEESIMYALKQN